MLRWESMGAPQFDACSIHTVCMSPRMEYRPINASPDACIPQWLLKMLHDQHGSLRGPCPRCLSADGLQAPWSSTAVNFVNWTFSNAQIWLQKAASEACVNRCSIVLLPFRHHIRYMWHTLHHAHSVCTFTSHPPRDARGGTLQQAAASTGVLPELRHRSCTESIRINSEGLGRCACATKMRPSSVFKSAQTERAMSSSRRLPAQNRALLRCRVAPQRCVPHRWRPRRCSSWCAHHKALCSYRPRFVARGSQEHCVEESLIVSFTSEKSLVRNEASQSIPLRVLTAGTQLADRLS